MSSGGSIDRMLDSIPGYAGYRDKERRRDSDRVVRENLAREYGQLAERLGRLATTLADERKIMAIPVVDKPYKRLTSFIDRVRTASYGYAPLFSEVSVDADALDQVALFDRALADQKQTLSDQIASLEQTSPDDAAFKSLANEIVATVEGLHERFDKRHEVIHAGKSLPPKDVVSYLEPTRPTTTGPAYRLHENEAVSYDGVNYTVAGRVTVESDNGAWRAFQLRGGTGDAWLVVSADQAQPAHWMRRVTIKGNVGDETATANGATYNRESVLSGKGEVIGASGAADNQPVRFGRYRASTGDDLLIVFDWDSGTLALQGAEANPASLDVFTRET
jgi:hypothetical protein